MPIIQKHYKKTGYPQQVDQRQINERMHWGHVSAWGMFVWWDRDELTAVNEQHEYGGEWRAAVAEHDRRQALQDRLDDGARYVWRAGGNVNYIIERVGDRYRMTEHIGLKPLLAHWYDFAQLWRKLGHANLELLGYRLQVTAEDAFEIAGIPFRVYDNCLWLDGGDHDDYHLDSIPHLEAVSNYTTHVTIYISRATLDQARATRREWGDV